MDAVITAVSDSGRLWRTVSPPAFCTSSTASCGRHVLLSDVLFDEIDDGVSSLRIVCSKIRTLEVFDGWKWWWKSS